MPDKAYMEEVRRICTQHGALMIVDEVICGFGRSGRSFGHHNFGVSPDIVTMAKGITSGYLPLAATAVKREIYQAFCQKGEYDHLRHVNTFGGHPASCAVALANLELMEREKLRERSSLLGARLLEELGAALAGHPLAGDVRGFGFMAGIELVEDRQSRKPAAPDVVQGIIDSCRRRGLIIGKNGDTVAGYNNVLTLAPPLSSTDEDLDFLLAALLEALEEASPA